MKRIVIVISFIYILFSCGEKQNDQADKIYFNAKIWTGDTANTWADAMAIKGNEILYVGKDYQSLKGNTEMIDLGWQINVTGIY